MPPREVRACLRDILDACDAIMQASEGKSFEDYRGSRALRGWIERELITVGEATLHAIRADASIERTLPDARRIVDFRNVLVHGYHVVDDEVVWKIATERVSQLRGEVASVMQSLGEDEN